MKRFLSILIISCSILVFQACKKNKEAIPAYIHIDKISLTITNSAQGSGSEKISDAWVYIDEKLSGGNLLTSTVFYEYRMSTITVGLAGELQKIEAQTKTYDQEQSANTSPEVEPANAKLLARLYLPVQLTSNLMIQPSLEYASYYDFDKDNIKSINESKGEINIRYAF